MNADQIIEYANAVQAYKNAQESHAEAVADAHQAVNEAALELAASEQTLRECIERIGSDPMNVLKKQRVRVTDEDREVVLAALLRDSGTEADVAKDAERSIEVTRLALRHLSRIGKATKDGRGASAVWSASSPKWSEQTAPSIADKVNELLDDAPGGGTHYDEGTFAEPVQNVDPVF